MKISGLIIAYNEANMIERPIKSLQSFCDEVIIMDSYSEDGTPQVSKVLGAKVYQYEFDNFRDQKNRGIERCTGDWVAILDADEYFSDNIPNQISNILSIADAQGIDALAIPRWNNEGEIHKKGWPDYQTRFIKPYVRHWDNPIHPQVNRNSKRQSQIHEDSGCFIWHVKSRARTDNQSQMYYKMRAIDFQAYAPPAVAEIKDPNWENREFLDFWTEWHHKKRQFTEVREF